VFVPRALILSAEMNADWKGTGARGGQIIEMNRKLVLTLSALELKQIFESAVAAGLLEPSFIIPVRRKKLKQVLPLRKVGCA